jgi:hypothetical protein
MTRSWAGPSANIVGAGREHALLDFAEAAIGRVALEQFIPSRPKLQQAIKPPIYQAAKE